AGDHPRRRDTVSVWVIGGGVIGSLFAAHLSRVAEVTLVCRRPEHAATVAENGIRVSGRADFVGQPRASTDPAGLADAELVIVATKANDVEAAAAQLEDHLGDGTVMTVQNGPGARALVEADLQRDREQRRRADRAPARPPFRGAKAADGPRPSGALPDRGRDADRERRRDRAARGSLADERACYAARQPALPVD